jgi:serine phosphatase RsbU (regulator of sigma subunit)
MWENTSRVDTEIASTAFYERLPPNFLIRYSVAGRMKSLLKRMSKRAHVVTPVNAPFPSLRGADISAAFAGNRHGGDFYDSFRVNADRILFGLLDVAGPRGSNLNVFSTAKRVFRDAGEQLLESSGSNEADALIELCLRLNRAILEAAGRAHSCPAFVGCYNEDLGTVCYFNTGHTPGLVRHSTDISVLGATGLPLGLFSHTTTDARIVALETGAALVLVSKGVVEVSRKGEEFGLNRVEEVLQAHRAVAAQDLCSSVLKAAQHFSASRVHDDLTALALIRTAN